MVAVTVAGVPSTLATVKTSWTCWPSFSSLKALLATKDHWPLLARVKVPLSRTMVVAVKLLSGLSTSVLVRVPLRVSGALVSTADWATSPLITAASLVPVMMTVRLLVLLAPCSSVTR